MIFNLKNQDRRAFNSQSQTFFISNSCCTRITCVACVALVLHLYRSCLTLLALVSLVSQSRRTGIVLVSHFFYTCIARVALVSLVSHSCRLCQSCRNRVARVWHSCCRLISWCEIFF